jgi:hypothetical protein
MTNTAKEKTTPTHRRSAIVLFVSIRGWRAKRLSPAYYLLPLRGEETAH